MSKTAWTVNRDALTSAVAEADNKKPSNYSAMCKIAADLYNKKYKSSDDREITFSVVNLRIEEFKIEFKTPKRKRECGPRQPKEGAQSGPDPFPTATATQRNRLTGNPRSITERPLPKALDGSTDTIAILRKRVPESMLGLVERVANGSRAAAVKLHCVMCCGYVRKEVRMCIAYSCPLHPFRPYQTKTIEEIDDPEYVEDDTGEETEEE